MPIASEQGKQPAFDALTQRRERSAKDGQIDNAALPAGAPMYYYCNYCGLHVETLPEDWYQTPPKKACEECQDLLNHGWHDNEKPQFPRKN